MTAKIQKGRPTKFSEKLGLEINARIARGQSLRQISDDPMMPSKSTVCRWLVMHPEFQDQYARAREVQADLLAEEVVEIADDSSLDLLEIRDEQGRLTGYQQNHAKVQRDRLRADSRKWRAAKLSPKKYGNSSKVELTGADGGAIKTESMPKDKMSPKSVREEIFRILGDYGVSSDRRSEEEQD